MKKGETVGVIGRNGSGKSTLLQLICGTLNPTSGSIQAQGRIAALLELGSGFNPEFTGRENVYLNGAILGLSREEIDKRFDKIAAFADIGSFIEQPVKTYSSGMMVRLAFAVQAMVDPEILIVDEALAVGDEKFQRKCFARLEELKSQGTSILFVSHSGPQIVELCEKALFLEQGNRLMYSSPSQIVRAYQKLIYAPPDDQQRLVEEYCSKDQLSEKNAVLTSENPETCLHIIKEGNYHSGLIPASTVEYPAQGAKITGMQIRGSNNANILKMGEEYKFVLTGNFSSDAEKVYFGIHIRSISGMVITGQRFPEEGKYIERIRTGTQFEIDFGFSIILLPGTYFVGGGIWSNQEPTSCLHRIIDKLMFRVITDANNKSFGYVDASSYEPIVKIL